MGAWGFLQREGGEIETFVNLSNLVSWSPAPFLDQIKENICMFEYVPPNLSVVKFGFPKFCKVLSLPKF